MHSAIKHMQITTKVDQISEGNVSMQSTSQVLKKMSSRAHRPAAQKGIECILEANPSSHFWQRGCRWEVLFLIPKSVLTSGYSKRRKVEKDCLSPTC